VTPEGGAHEEGSVGEEGASSGSRVGGAEGVSAWEKGEESSTLDTRRERRVKRWLEGHIPAISIERPESQRPCMKV